MLSRGEKDMLFTANMAVGNAIWLRQFYEDLDMPGVKRDFSLIKTNLIKATAEISKRAGSDKKIERLFENMKYRSNNRINSYNLSITLDEDPKCHKYFARYAVIYIAVRDLLNYYQVENPDKIDGEVLSWIKTCKTIITRVFKEHAKDADLNWGAIRHVLDNKTGKYEFEGRIVYL